MLVCMLECLLTYMCLYQKDMHWLVLCVNGNRVQVTNAVDHVQRGNTALQNAKKLQKNSRKWMCIAIIILLLIVAIVVVGVLRPWKSGKALKLSLCLLTM